MGFLKKYVLSKQYTSNVDDKSQHTIPDFKYFVFLTLIVLTHDFFYLVHFFKKLAIYT